ncbi:MAG: alcohol dehydrogenase catalytic domain-containing protein [Planctomycetaceae bacterium]
MEFRQSLPEPTPAPGEVLVDIVVAGLCETDLQLAKGYMGFAGIPGHEFVGVPRTGRWASQRVVGEINCGCGVCDRCRAGWSRHCPHRTVLGILGRPGAFAQTIALPEGNLLPVPDHVSTADAVWTEPLAAAFRIPEQLPLVPGTPALVLGDGRLGNLCAQVLALHGCRVEVVGKHLRKLQRLAELGLATCLLGELDPARRFPLVVDCTGSPSGLATALAAVEPQGTVVLKTTVAGPHQLPLAPVVIDEVRVLGSRCGPFAPALAALARGEIALAGLVEEVVSLAEVPAALERAGREPLLKILVDVAGGLKVDVARR